MAESVTKMLDRNVKRKVLFISKFGHIVDTARSKTRILNKNSTKQSCRKKEKRTHVREASTGAGSHDVLVH